MSNIVVIRALIIITAVYYYYEYVVISFKSHLIGFSDWAATSTESEMLLVKSSARMYMFIPICIQIYLHLYSHRKHDTPLRM